MKIKRNIFAIFLLSGLFAFAQEPEGDATVPTFAASDLQEDQFQIFFFEALKQKGIENYELALTALEKAEKVASNREEQSVVLFEKAKNHAFLKEYSEAEQLYKQVLAAEGDRLDVLEHLYDVYYRQMDYEKALPIVLKLIPFHDDYKEDLVNLYINTERYDEALKLLKELESIWGESDIRNALKARIYKVTGKTDQAIDELESKIESNPKNEKEYLNLIFLYSEQGDKTKAFETAQELLKAIPDSKLVHLALYKFYIEQNRVEEALNSMKIVFGTSEIDDETMLKVMNDFIHFVDSHPQYKQDLEEISEVYSKRNPKVFELMGNYYLAKNQKLPALEYYEKGAVGDPQNFPLIKNTLLLQLDHQKFREAESLSSKALNLFPAQALLYLLNGVANIGLNQYDKAIEILDMGIDFVPDDPKMEKDFYSQLSQAYRAKGDIPKSESYQKRADNIQLAD